MPKSAKRRLITAFMAAGLVGGLVMSPSASADPEVPAPPVPVEPAAPPAPPNPFAFPPPAAPAAVGPADPATPGATATGPDAQVVTNYGAPAVPIEGVPEGQNPEPFTGQPPFLPPSFNPVNGSMVGVAKPIYINFQRPIANKQMAQDAIRITSNPPVPGRFYWVTDTQLRWRPQDFWPSNTVVNIDAAGTKSSFRVGDYLVATVDDSTHQMEIRRNGKLEKTFPVSMGKNDGKHETKNGTYYVLEKFEDIVMDSSTYGVPVDSAEGYKLKVKDAVRIDNSGIFVHSAPWSVGDQGKRNVSHGCINLSPENARWFYEQFGSGDPVVIKNSKGGWYDQPDGASDWQMF